MTSDSLTVSSNYKVRFNEVDMLNIVWHGHYITYFELGREAFGAVHGISYLDVKHHGFATPVTKSSCEHFLPLKYGDEFTVETTFVNSKSAKMIFNYRIFKDGELVCKGSTEQVFLDAENELQLYNPPFYQAWKNQMGLE